MNYIKHIQYSDKLKRIFYPIINPKGYNIGYTGRYIGESTAFSKHLVVYNDPDRREKTCYLVDDLKTPKGSIVIVEDYLSALKIFYSDVSPEHFIDVVSLNGTHCSKDTMTKLLDYETINIHFDPDTTGKDISRKLFEELSLIHNSVNNFTELNLQEPKYLSFTQLLKMYG